VLADLSEQSSKVKVALKYCGSCNPYVDLSRIAHHLAQAADRWADFELVPLSEKAIAVVVILCGCPRTCGDKEEVKARAAQSLVIAGESVGGKPVPEEHLPAATERELAKILEHLRDGLSLGLRQ